MNRLSAANRPSAANHPSRGKRPSLLARPAVFVPLLLVVLAAGGFAWRVIATRSAAEAARQQLVRDVEQEVQKRPLDQDELSRLVARLQKCEGHDADRDLVGALARIELARGRVDRAVELFAPIGGRPGAGPGEQRLWAKLLLRQNEAGMADRTAAAGALQQAQVAAEAAYADGHDAADLSVAWLAAARLPDDAAAGRLGELLLADHASSPSARLVQATRGFSLDTPRRDLETLRDEFADPPPEIEAMLTLVVLQKGDVAGAVALVEPLLARAAGLLAVRQAAALVFHACAAGCAEGSADRASWAKRRDVQLDFLMSRAPAEDPRRAQWGAMQQVR